MWDKSLTSSFGSGQQVWKMLISSLPQKYAPIFGLTRAMPHSSGKSYLPINTGGIGSDAEDGMKSFFCFLLCPPSTINVEAIGNDAFIDDMIEKGAKFAWFFTYMPVGRDAVPELIASPKQREHMYRFVRHVRETRPIFALDFWNDGEYVNGCVAGGRFYLHINANGDIEPCAFIHYSDSNIREKTLLEAYKSPLFMQYHANQPFNKNHLRPCPCLDNPHKLVEMVEKSGAKSTDVQAPEDVHDLAAKCEPVSEAWGKHADELWKEIRAAKMAAVE